jgi:hypothetical protein
MGAWTKTRIGRRFGLPASAATHLKARVAPVRALGPEVFENVPFEFAELWQLGRGLRHGEIYSHGTPTVNRRRDTARRVVSTSQATRGQGAGGHSACLVVFLEMCRKAVGLCQDFPVFSALGTPLQTDQRPSSQCF